MTFDQIKPGADDPMAKEGIDSKEVGSKPNIDIKVLFGAHRTEHDFGLLEAEIPQADIYFPENAGWEPSTEDAYNAYATGNYKVPENLDPFLKTELNALAKSGKEGKVVRVGLIDLPKGHPLLKSPISSNRAVVEFENGNFDKAMQDMKNASEQNALARKQREDYIQGQIRTKTDEIIESHPELKEKLNQDGKLNILLSLGSVHTRIVDELKKAGEKVEQISGETEDGLGPRAELEKKYLLGENVDDELVARAILFSELLSYANYTNDTIKIYQVLAKTSDSLKFEDISKISSDLKSGSEIVDVLKDFGIKFPQTEEEMNELLGN